MTVSAHQKAEFDKDLAKLESTRKAAITKATQAHAAGGPRAGFQQTIANAHDMLDTIDQHLAAAKTDAEIKGVLLEGIREFKDAIAFLEKHQALLLDPVGPAGA